MNYSGFAALYDHLMSEAPYDSWVDYIKRSCERTDLTGLRLLDVGCGTGELLMSLLQEEMNVTGVDLSPEMLAMAQDKASKKGWNPWLVEADMTDLEVLGEYDLVTVFCDSLNYLPDSVSVQRAFHSFANQLVTGGLLLFDVHSQQKINKGFVGQTFADADDDVSYIWTSYAGEEADSVEHELSFFAKMADDRYERFDEIHFQRTFPVTDYLDWLSQAGFKVEAVTADFSTRQPCENSERIFFKAVKV
ncbi:class I SAM-dependent DNA methyltransferase [Alkalicoccobacillus porphyridii]|uniref:Methyltransferase domain-containing protein n=1 Tax=Alkalicoccobacillus porphyridii TaxID=2597270 RepID=A0A553ZZB6_9BACI|nr:class I SAM-dependent methyltransferase [Alkalicoccobacillus porphyridii]TSB46788.1 methyltransferase domain-containing protein [Alkalicoccobacillus porphyridii]